MSDRYMGLTPAETLEQYPVLTLTQTAWVLQELFVKGAKKGEPDRRKVLALMSRGALRPISTEGASAHWKVSGAEVRRYMDQGSDRDQLLELRAATRAAVQK